MLAHDGSTHKHSLLGNNNQQGGEDASQTSGSVANNWSLPTRCCCRPAGALASVAPTEPSFHAIACQSCEIVSEGNAPPAHCTGHGKLWFCTSGYQRRSIALLPGWTWGTHNPWADQRSAKVGPCHQPALHDPGA